MSYLAYLPDLDEVQALSGYSESFWKLEVNQKPASGFSLSIQSLKHYRNDPKQKLIHVSVYTITIEFLSHPEDLRYLGEQMIETVKNLHLLGALD